MRRFTRVITNKFLRLFGLKIVRMYEFEYLQKKYYEIINETQNLFKLKIFKDFPANEQRTLLLSNLYGTQVSEALYIIRYLHKSLQFSGDVCEFGCANGATSALIANEMKNNNKKLWLFDSFQGLSKPTKKDELINDIFHLGSMGKYQGLMSYSIQEVKSRLKNASIPTKKIRIIPGFIEDTIKRKKLPKKICFAYVDFDLYEPTKTALEYLHIHLYVGGHIVVDDYQYFSLGAKTAVDEFYASHKQEYKISFPGKFAGHFCIMKKTK